MYLKSSVWHNSTMIQDREVIRRTLIRNIRKYRLQAKLTQQEAAERANITDKYWQRLEMKSQADLPSLPVLFSMAKALGIKAYRLLQD